ncbi:type III secretion protein [Erwiniaceae bacterium BAC15a-03b]|uniref:Type III secretion protein n=1 Tax=Winslowiella arboricola TaxID=2978220 RepID=A0A9J6PPX8_9GAMM|nr:FHA domain-containing protein [Winslowiella arboricola]MCU5773674.1 type III secretion protein [Winslowiella arboricola]MCU5778427.1 type III secretion protein [Winslowiella arboricola]
MMFELRVLSGLHLGAALPLFGDSWLIGPAEEADLQLSDAAIDSDYRLLRPDEESWQLQQAVTDSSLQDLVVSESFSLGGVWLCVAAADTAWSAFTPPPVAEPVMANEAPAVAAPAKGGFPRWISALMLSLTLLLTFTVVSWILQPTVAQSQINQSGRQHLDTPAEMRAPLLNMLRERDLAAAVSVVNGKKTLTLKGKLNKEQMLVFNRMLARFNADYMTAEPLVNQVTPLKIELPFRIVQITTGARANIVTDEGQRLFIGDEVDNLRLVAITSNRIEFNGRDNIKVSW